MECVGNPRLASLCSPASPRLDCAWYGLLMLCDYCLCCLCVCEWLVVCVTGVGVRVFSAAEPALASAERRLDASWVLHSRTILEHHARVESVLQPHVALSLPIELLLQYATVQKLHTLLVSQRVRHDEAGRCSVQQRVVRRGGGCVPLVVTRSAVCQVRKPAVVLLSGCCGAAGCRMRLEWEVGCCCVVSCCCASNQLTSQPIVDSSYCL